MSLSTTIACLCHFTFTMSRDPQEIKKVIKQCPMETRGICLCGAAGLVAISPIVAACNSVRLIANLVGAAIGFSAALSTGFQDHQVNTFLENRCIGMFNSVTFMPRYVLGTAGIGLGILNPEIAIDTVDLCQKLSIDDIQV